VPFLLFGRSVYTVFKSDQFIGLFGCMSLGFIARGYELARPSAMAALALLADLV
jgi:hypothetical protein